MAKTIPQSKSKGRGAEKKTVAVAKKTKKMSKLGKWMRAHPEGILEIVNMNVERNADRLVLTPVGEVETENDADPADYPDTTAYLSAIPGMVESILESSCAPASAFHTARPESFRA